MKGGVFIYSITELAKLSGVTTRTLRYYDSIDLLKPTHIKENGYRYYSEKELDRLQQILFYKQFNFSLDEIKSILSDDSDCIIESLSNHFDKLLEQKKQLDRLILSLDKTIKYYKGELNMTNDEKFEAFKQQQIKTNQEKYGEELLQKYDTKEIETYESNWMNLSQNDFNDSQEAEQRLFNSLNQLEQEEITDVSHPLAEEAFLAHKKWLSITSPFYSSVYHQQMLDMYLADERFTSYYTKHISKNSLVFLKEIVYYYTLNK
ncbi:MerR family transcriptional regulator [Vagococcus teuberi]|uniref:HTH merR-type domain-containing protein n=1 Tax=Vagococcus teuberi TaxID=519472 RepID=A0A1J0A473_9ENTE|nr:MerR family transcriptional regulator [Vagococcus teuberi]APB30713.1 hypothetical protein BHY08_02030 [Vagococcus teuberi]